MPKQKKEKECNCKLWNVLYTAHRMNPKKLSIRPAVIVCQDCGKRMDVQAVGFTLNVKDSDVEES